MGVAAAIAGAAVIGGVTSVISGNKAANAQKYAADQSAAVQQRIFDQQRADNAPWRNVGQSALYRLAGLSGLSKTGKGDAGTPDYSAFTSSPGYQFRLDEGMKAIERSAAARGGLRSGATMKSLNNYAQGEASQEYGNEWNRMAGLAGVGQTANGQNQQAGQAYANSLQSAYTNAGNARASAYQNTGNAISSSVNGLASIYGYNATFGGGGGGGAAPASAGGAAFYDPSYNYYGG